MAFTPYEKLNAFDQDLMEKLDSRRRSTNLVQVKTPFIRYTTAIDFNVPADSFSNIINFAGSLSQAKSFWGNYADCKFFTLGLHGWDNKDYSKTDIYNSQAQTGLIVGTTYKSGQKILVKTPNYNDISPTSYPPPGIESAIVERNRNGNVLKFTLNVVCYTQAQMDMLDVLAFVPGMDCVLEWGNVSSNSDKPQLITTMLNYDYPSDIVGILKGMKKGFSRTEFIKTWCTPNNYNYDFGLGKIANIKTSVEDNKYKVTIIAYGQADSLMYISAYATSTQKEKVKKAEEVESDSIHQYFSENSDFILDLQNADSITDIKDKVVKFDEPVDANKKKSQPGTATPTGTVNDLDQEKTYYVRFDAFINYFLNNKILYIIRKGLNSKTSPIKYVSDIKDSVTDYSTIVGYNKHLKSTDPSVLIIVNKAANEDNSPYSKETLATIVKNSNGQINSKPDENSSLPDLLKKGIDAVAFETDSSKESGTMLPTQGVWLNSKTIQQVFLGARTVTEGLETLLNKINTSTEGYWDLKLMHEEGDTEAQFRIVDDNHTLIPTTQQIYTFNKKLSQVKNTPDTLGSEVLSLKIDSDYPKLFFSQLAISAVNNSVSSITDSKNLYSVKKTNRLKSLLDDPEEPPKPTPSLNSPYVNSPGTFDIYTIIQNNPTLKNSLGIFGTPISDAINALQYAPPEVSAVLKDAASKTGPLTTGETLSYMEKLNSIYPPLTVDQIDNIEKFFKARAQALITEYKDKEVKAYDKIINTLYDKFPILLDGETTAKTNIKNSKDTLLAEFN